MVKSLKYRNNKEATLTIGQEVYHGRILREPVGKAVERDGRRHQTLSYYFLTNEGTKIQISNESITVFGSSLVLKLNPPFFK